MHDSVRSCLRLMLLVLCIGAEACADASPRPASDTAGTASVDSSAADAGLAAGDPDPAPAVPDGAAPISDAGALACEVYLPDGVERASDCPATAPISTATPCTLPANAVCLYSDPRIEPKPSVQVFTCDQPTRSWRLDGPLCDRTCGAPQNHVVEVDASSCAMRPFQTCGEGLTAQAQLDTVVHDALSQISAPLGLMQWYAVTFEDGCPTSVFDDPSERSADLASLLGVQLAGTRWTCARELSCAMSFGPTKAPPPEP